MYEPKAYRYNDLDHCPNCAKEKFGKCEVTEEIACFGFGPDCTHETPKDDEDNIVDVIGYFDEWWDLSSREPQTLTCGTCGETIDEVSSACDVCDTPIEAGEQYSLSPDGEKIYCHEHGVQEA